MALIEDLTKTHAALDTELDRFRRLLDSIVNGDDRDKALGALKAELAAINHKLEQHIESEAALEVRSDEVLGEGSMQDYGVGAHHANLRASVEKLDKHLSADGSFAEAEKFFDVFMDHYEKYTKAEWDFLQANSSILYPGGSTDG